MHRHLGMCGLRILFRIGLGRAAVLQLVHKFCAILGGKMSSLGDRPVDPTLNVPLYWQLYLHLRAAILTERLKKGMKLPSTRALADELHVSRNTVVNAYDQLLAEGYLESIAASGTYVASVLPDQYLTRPTSSTASNAIKPSSNERLRLSRIGEALLTAPSPLSPRASVYQARAFVAGMPALDAFPYELWSKLVARYARHATADALMYQDSAGYPPLRTAIAEHITVTRQVRCTPDQIDPHRGRFAGRARFGGTPAS